MKLQESVTSALNILAKESKTLRQFIQAAKREFKLKDGQETVQSLTDIYNSAKGVSEVLPKTADVGDYIEDFKKSKAPQFRGKSEKKIEKMAKAAWAANKGKKMTKEEITEALVQILFEDANVAARVKSKKNPNDPGSIEIMNRDKMNALKQTGQVDVQPLEEDDWKDPTDESSMAKSQLYSTAKYAIELMKMIEDGEQLDAWVQSKITKAADYIDAVKHYMEGEKALGVSEGGSDGDFEAQEEDKQMSMYYYDKGLEAYSEGDLLKADKYYTAALRRGHYLGWDERDLPPYKSVDENSTIAEGEYMWKDQPKDRYSSTLRNKDMLNQVGSAIGELTDLAIEKGQYKPHPEKGVSRTYTTRGIIGQLVADQLRGFVDRYEEDLKGIKILDKAGYATYEPVWKDTEPKSIVGPDPRVAGSLDEKLDPVGHEDEDVDNDGKKNTKTDKYIKNRRVKIGAAIAQAKKK